MKMVDPDAAKEGELNTQLMHVADHSRRAAVLAKTIGKKSNKKGMTKMMAAEAKRRAAKTKKMM